MVILNHQLGHFLSLAILVGLLYFCTIIDNSVLDGEFLGISTGYWSLITLLVAVVHQVYVLLCWRYELNYNSLSNRYGQKAFEIFKIGFALLFVSRLISLTLLAISNSGTLNINTALKYILTTLLMILWLLLAYSFRRYFGIDRAMGLDHFEPRKYRGKGLVNQGIFKYTSNGMYFFGPLILWVIALLLESKAALLLAGFSHLYIWVHYFFTELPDMKEIYGISPK